MPPGQSNFYGQKLSKQGIPVQNASDSQLLWKEDYNNNLKTWYGTNGAVMQEGKLPQGGYGLRIPDSNGVGVAQFGQFPDGSIALKVATPGVEVATAPNSQLIFNSSQDMFKIVTKGTSTIPSMSFTPGNGGYSQVVIPHGLAYTPLVNVYVQGQILNASLTPIATSYIPLPIFTTTGPIQYYFAGNAGNNYPCTVLYGIDATNLYLQAYYTNPGAGVTGSINAIPATYFLLQETVTG